MTAVYLLRHAETEWSRTGRHTSRTDLPLTPTGERRADDSGRLLATMRGGEPPALIASSPRTRALRTAELAGYSMALREPRRQTLEHVLSSERYATLLDVLVEAAREPQLSAAADEDAATVLTRMVARPWRQLSTSGRGRVGAGDLDVHGPDDDWHSVRIRAKRARYAVESVAKLIGGSAAALGESLTEVQELLGEHQDAAVAAGTWLAIARSDVDDHTLAVTAGRLVERERAAVRRVRERFPAAWAAASTPKNTGWLHP